MKRLIVLFILLFLMGCGSSREVTRMEPAVITDLSGKWNDTDSRLVAEEMIADCLARPWLTNYQANQAKQPVIIVGNIYNKTHEHINEDTFIKDIERAFINSGLVQVVQSGAMRDDIRNERADQQEFASEETRKKWRQETGADYMMSAMKNPQMDDGMVSATLSMNPFPIGWCTIFMTPAPRRPCGARKSLKTLIS